MSVKQLRVRGLCVRYGHEAAIDGLDLDLEPGRSYALVGPSGCGKTTLLYTLAGILKPDEGTVEVGGQALEGIRPGTGLVTQRNTLLPWKTVRQNVALGLSSRGVDKAQAYARTLDILSELGLAAHADKYPAQLSGGQAQRVSLARTLITSPDILLMDEPTSQLDQMTKEDVQDLILRLYKRRPVLSVLVTHSIEEAAFLGSRVFIMRAGAIVAAFDNPHFGDESARMSEEFYRLVMELRRSLAEDAA